MAETSSLVEDGGDNVVSISHGGPIYIPDMVGPLTRVSDFEASVFHELQNLKALLRLDSLETCDVDISVDELKIVTDEELVNKAFEEAFKDNNVTGNSSQVSGEHSNAGRENDDKMSSPGHTCLESYGRRNGLASSENLNSSPLRTSDTGELSNDISRQRKRKRKRNINRKNHTLEESVIAKVEELARIKQKQDEDKAAARLHSFIGSCRINECPTSSTEKIERVTSLKSTSSTTKARSSSTHEHVPVLYPEVVLCIEVYHNRRTWTKTQEFLVLGRQFLIELRDKIYCLTDQVMQKAGQYDPSGYFLIEDIFCNDLREPNAIDYSQSILDWFEKSKNDAIEKWECIMSGELQQKQKELLGSETELRLPKFKAVDMQKTHFCDLRFRLGAGYLYCHQGDCRHVIVVRDMRLIHPEDVQNRTAYPIVTFQLKLRFQKCSVCKISRAEKVTVDDKWAVENPCNFCGLCYYMLHYVNGPLLYNEFAVYDYLHD